LSYQSYGNLIPGNKDVIIKKAPADITTAEALIGYFLRKRKIWL
jgi:hypothetical protein